MVKKKDTAVPSGVLVPGFLLLGIGIGFLIDAVAAGTLIGLGLGFIGMYVFGKK